MTTKVDEFFAAHPEIGAANADSMTAEIARLRSVNAELLAAMTRIARQDCPADDMQSADDLRQIARAAIAKATHRRALQSSRKP